MDYKYLLAVAVIFIILLLAACVILLLLYQKCRVAGTKNEKMLLNRLNAAIKYSNERTDFFSNMTHELKTPLSVILGAIQLMEMKKKGQVEEDSSFCKNMRIIKYNCYSLLRLTNNLLDLNKMETGYLKLSLINCELNLLLEEIVQSVKPYAIQKQLVLNYSKPSEVISTAVDIEKMERIMLNLLSNAIKFTKPGGTVSVSSYTAQGRVFISVKDSGAGIPAEKQEEVFERFKQVGNCPSVENKGSGIGLSLVKSFVSLHLGSIRINSEQDQGCEFVIDLPIRHVNDDAGKFGYEDYYTRIAEAAKIEFSALHSIAS